MADKTYAEAYQEAFGKPNIVPNVAGVYAQKLQKQYLEQEAQKQPPDILKYPVVDTILRSQGTSLDAITDPTERENLVNATWAEIIKNPANREFLNKTAQTFLKLAGAREKIAAAATKTTTKPNPFALEYWKHQLRMIENSAKAKSAAFKNGVNLLEKRLQTDTAFSDDFTNFTTNGTTDKDKAVLFAASLNSLFGEASPYQVVKAGKIQEEYLKKKRKFIFDWLAPDIYETRNADLWLVLPKPEYAGKLGIEKKGKESKTQSKNPLGLTPPNK